MDRQEIEKKRAAKASLAYVRSDMVIGLGTGSTSEHMVRYLGEMVANGLRIVGVPSSKRTAALASSLNIPLTTLDKVGEMDLYIDGADEIDGNRTMIKGGGGALLREKILAHNSKKNVIIVDSSKCVKKLGAFKLPVEVIPFAEKPLSTYMDRQQLHPVIRMAGNAPFVTDENNHILDLDIQDKEDYDQLNRMLLSLPGVVETGLFIDYAHVLIDGGKLVEID